MVPPPPPLRKKEEEKEEEEGRRGGSNGAAPPLTDPQFTKATPAAQSHRAFSPNRGNYLTHLFTDISKSTGTFSISSLPDTIPLSPKKYQETEVDVKKNPKLYYDKLNDEWTDGNVVYSNAALISVEQWK